MTLLLLLQNQCLFFSDALFLIFCNQSQTILKNYTNVSKVAKENRLTITENPFSSVISYIFRIWNRYAGFEGKKGDRKGDKRQEESAAKKYEGREDKLLLRVEEDVIAPIYLWLRPSWISRWTRRRRRTGPCVFGSGRSPSGSRRRRRWTRPRGACCCSRRPRSVAARSYTRCYSSRCRSRARATAAVQSSRWIASREVILNSNVALTTSTRPAPERLTSQRAFFLLGFFSSRFS